MLFVFFTAKKDTKFFLRLRVSAVFGFPNTLYLSLKGYF